MVEKDEAVGVVESVEVIGLVDKVVIMSVELMRTRVEICEISLDVCEKPVTVSVLVCCELVAEGK